jgi:prevent-host-death family protein
MRRISASDFKATCLALLDEVARTGEPIEVLKRGKTVARVVAAPPEQGEFPQDSLRGTVTICGDILKPVLCASAWDVLSESNARRSGRARKRGEPARKSTQH